MDAKAVLSDGLLFLHSVCCTCRPAVEYCPPPYPRRNQLREKMMSFYRGMTCENVTIKGDKGTPITAYTAKPEGKGPFPGVVLVHHLPGWSELYIETTRRFAHHGYMAICANLYERAGEGNPDDVAAKVRAEGGIADSQMVGDTEAAVKWMRAQPGHNGKVGIFGSCSGGPPRLHLCLPEKGRRRLRRAVGRPRGDGQGGAQREDSGRA